MIHHKIKMRVRFFLGHPLFEIVLHAEMDSFRPICSCHLIKIQFQAIFEYDFLKTQFRLFWNILFTMSEWWQWWSLEWILLALFFNSLLCTLYFNLFNPSKVEKTVWNSRIRFWRCCSISLLWVLCKYSNCKWAGCKKSLKKNLIAYE